MKLSRTSSKSPWPPTAFLLTITRPSPMRPQVHLEDDAVVDGARSSIKPDDGEAESESN